jgi:hypothetical protein
MKNGNLQNARVAELKQSNSFSLFWISGNKTLIVSDLSVKTDKVLFCSGKLSSLGYFGPWAGNPLLWFFLGGTLVVFSRITLSNLSGVPWTFWKEEYLVCSLKGFGPIFPTVREIQEPGEISCIWRLYRFSNQNINQTLNCCF